MIKKKNNQMINVLLSLKILSIEKKRELSQW